MRKIEADAADLEFAPMFGSGVCAGGGSCVVWIKASENVLVDGGKFITNANAVYGDWLEIQAVDKDNILNMGAGLVLKNWIPKYGVDWKNNADLITLDYKGDLLKDLYLKATYHSVGTLSVSFSINVFAHRRL